MEAWLLFPVRIVAIGFIAVLAYYACDGVQQQLMVLSEEAAPTVDRATDHVPPARVHALPLLTGIFTFVTILTVVESIAIRRFRTALAQINQLHGSVQFDPPSTTIVTQYLAKIATVDLSDTSVDETSFPALQSIHNLKALRVANTRIGGDVVRKIASCRRLERLDLSQTGLADADLEPLQSLPLLRALIVNETGISDAAVPYLSSCQALVTLELQDTGITDDGRRELMAALPDTEIIGASIAI